MQQDCLGILEQTAACTAGLKTVSTADRRIFRDCGVFLSQEIASCERKSLRRGAHCPVDNGFAPTETECRLRSPQKRSHILGYRKMPCGKRRKLHMQSERARNKNCVSLQKVNNSLSFFMCQ